MHILEAVLILLGLVLISNVASHYITIVPVSLIQIVLGVGMALLFDFKIDLDTTWFLLLFIAPLLFNDGRDFPKKELWELRGPIFENAIWLVFLTTIVGGFIVNWIIPSMPLAVCFALIAILSPTDPVAVQSISKRVNLPKSILHLVSGESLINDASGLIAFKYAIVAVVTGYFSFYKAAGDFIYMSLMGLFIGWLLMQVLLWVRNKLDSIHFHDAIFSVVLQILTPFLIYVVAEDYLHASGVIAVVTAGILDHLQSKRVTGQTPEITLLTNRTWDIIVYCLNGVVFLILGIELPIAMQSVIKGNKYGTLESIGYAFLIWLMILIIRVVWILGYQSFSYYVTKRERKKPQFKIGLLAGLSGVRGAITMAGVLSVPAVIDTGAPFPDRALMLFIAAGVIVISLVAASITLPLIAPGQGTIKTRASSIKDDEPEDDNEEENEKQNSSYVSYAVAKLYMMNSAIAYLESNKTESNQRAVFDIIMDYEVAIRKQQRRFNNRPETTKNFNETIALRRVALKGQRNSIEELYQQKLIGPDAYWIATRHLNQDEYRLSQATGSKQSRIKVQHISLWTRIIHLLKFWQWNQQATQKTKDDLRLVQRVASQGAIKAINTFLNRDDINRKDFSAQNVHFLLVYYQNQVQKAKSFGDTKQEEEQYEREVLELQTQSLEAQRKAIETLIDNGHISRNMGLHLRQNVNYEETILLNEYKREND
ncbi:sodium:proton antiporter [Fructilactobacillus hinvesii]|uniref:Sodium:proton antiporter n=1 Tax=Fructilactobacillus hinvesii TaxID=2940300 RepID=A0ABY5BSG6_9LACO|nr:sodium:proton antiporter [Fructilactobacillus hinvesii]USS88059.1 sodium:proton antiporter [Fructilactobacillus hinvesii]